MHDPITCTLLFREILSLVFEADSLKKHGTFLGCKNLLTQFQMTTTFRSLNLQLQQLLSLCKFHKDDWANLDYVWTKKIRLKLKLNYEICTSNKGFKHLCETNSSDVSSNSNVLTVAAVVKVWRWCWLWLLLLLLLLMLLLSVHSPALENVVLVVFNCLDTVLNNSEIKSQSLE